MDNSNHYSVVIMDVSQELYLPMTVKAAFDQWQPAGRPTCMLISASPRGVSAPNYMLG